MSNTLQTQKSYWTLLQEAFIKGAYWMMPFVVAGGMLIALAFAIGGYEIVYQDQAEFLQAGFNIGSAHDWAYVMFAVGAATFGFLVPVLSGFIAYGIGGRSALVAGFAGGAIAGTIGAGFIGGIITGIIGGTIVLLLSSIKLPHIFKTVNEYIIIPVLSTFATAGIMLVSLGLPLKTLMTNLNNWLTSLSGANSLDPMSMLSAPPTVAGGGLVLLGLILGLMMAFDMGGPINKVAYTFAAAGLTEAGATAAANDPRFVIMAAVMAAGMVPPIAMGVAALISKKRFNAMERKTSIASIILGFFFITEGAIPYAARRPLKVIPALMLGSGTAGALVALFGSTLQAPHGGITAAGLVENLPMFLLAIAIGVAVSVITVLLTTTIGLKKDTLLNEQVIEEIEQRELEAPTYGMAETNQDKTPIIHNEDNKQSTKTLIVGGSVLTAFIVGLGILGMVFNNTESQTQAQAPYQKESSSVISGNTSLEADVMTAGMDIATAMAGGGDISGFVPQVSSPENSITISDNGAGGYLITGTNGTDTITYDTSTGATAYL